MPADELGVGVAGESDDPPAGGLQGMEVREQFFSPVILSRIN